MRAFPNAALAGVVLLTCGRLGVGDPSGSPATAPLPSVTQVLDRYVEALGGRKALEKIRSRHIRGEAEIGDLPASPAPWELITESPNKRLSILAVAGFGEVIEGFDGKVAWVKNPGQPVTERTGDELAKSRRDSVFNRELQMLKVYPDLALKRVDRVGDQEAYVAESRPSAGSLECLWFARQSGLLLRQETEVDTANGRVAASVLFEDYRKVDQVLLPHVLRIRVAGAAGDMDVVLRFKEVTHNVPVDDRRFSRPKG
jgi:hypothetical protein